MGVVDRDVRHRVRDGELRQRRELDRRFDPPRPFVGCLAQRHRAVESVHERVAETVPVVLARGRPAESGASRHGHRPSRDPVEEPRLPEHQVGRDLDDVVRSAGNAAGRLGRRQGVEDPRGWHVGNRRHEQLVWCHG